MIPLQRQPEPAGFSQKVRRPGAAFLRKAARPINWTNGDFWRRALPDLYEAYSGICAYSAEWIPYSTGDPTVDHFIPKSVNPQRAYEWENFRLAALKFNSRKGKYQDVLDPFKIGPEWFFLEFPSHLIKPNPALSMSRKERVNATIRRLKLNDDDNCVKSRLRWTLAFCDMEITLGFLKRHAPFIAHELERQGLVSRIALIMRS